MNLLFVTETHPDGRTKIHRLDPERTRVVLGTSRKADIRLPKNGGENIEGCLEYNQGEWTYHSFSLNEKSPLCVSLKQTPQFYVGSLSFNAQIIEEKPIFSQAPSEGPLGQQMILILFRGHVFHTVQVRCGETLRLELAGEQLTVATSETRNWLETQQGSFTIRQKTLPVVTTSDLNPALKDLHLRKSDKLTIAALVLTFLLGTLSSVLMPSKPVLKVTEALPKSSAPLVLKMVPPRERKVAGSQGGASSNRPGERVTTRIEDLSKNIALRAGKFLKKAARGPASIGPNGTMAAPALGFSRLGGSTTDWNAVAGSQVAGQIAGGPGFGTGKGNGQGLSGNGVGSSGVNLLEQESEVVGGLDREVIADFIRRNIGHILYCYERSLSANPNLFGKVSVRFVIGASGQVETQKIGESTLKDARVEGCILEKISRWKFPTPKGGVQVSVNYPFLFKTTN